MSRVSVMQLKNGTMTESSNGQLRLARTAGRNGNGHVSGLTPHCLVGEHLDQLGELPALVRRSSGIAPQHESYGNLRECGLRDREETIVLTVSSPFEATHARQLIQEAAIQKLTNTVAVVVLSSTLAPGLMDVEPHIAHFCQFPSGEKGLHEFLKERATRRKPADSSPFPDGSTEWLIARRLLAFTPSLLPLVEKLALAAEHDVTVLLTGETGTGKTFLAKLLHDFSTRQEERFLVIPCGALAPNLVESEFFGHVKGAFTGADRTKVGKFAAAGKGTLLLDEIDALGMDQQANLLRVVESGEYEPVGSTETQLSRCRLIVASNRNLKEEADQNRFRQDLYYRFNVMSFHLPPLRERVEDIAPLVRGFAARFCTKFRKGLFDISSEALAALESYSWPGNIRELENAIQHAVLVSQGPLLLARHLPETVLKHGLVIAAPPTPAVETLVHNREVIERTVIQRALSNHKFSRARAASELGISRVTLYKKMKKYGLMKDAVRLAE
jgi:DNA-binding NtrC family response regulator